jgi:glycolate oxidase FAD binding subunit
MTLRPQTEADLAEAIRAANGPLWIEGGGTRGLPGGAPVLCTAGLAGITLYEPGALTLIAGAGTPMAEIQAALAAEGQALPFQPGDPRVLSGAAGEPTLGGAVAVNAAGPRRLRAGAARDAVIGARFVDGAGTVIKSGGRVMKNVTGYDLARMMAGAHGMLGVLTEVALKLIPAPETSATLVLRDLNADRAVAAMARALGRTGGGERRGTYRDRRGGNDADPGRGVRSRGGRTGRHAARCVAGFRRDCGIETSDASAARWQAVADLAPLAGQTGDIWQIAVRATDLADLLARLGHPPALVDWGGARVFVATAPGRDIRAETGPGPRATLIRAAPGTALPRFPPEVPAVARLAAGLRARFDPRGILNPGLLG